MKISTILEHIDSEHMALPEFQRDWLLLFHYIRGSRALR
jgi:hypothetical protein